MFLRKTGIGAATAALLAFAANPAAALPVEWGTGFQAAVGSRLAAGEIEDADLGPFVFEFQDCAGGAELGVVGVGGDDEDVQHQGTGDRGQEDKEICGTV